MPNICHELIIGAPAEKIYSAITSQDGLSSWWTPGAEARAERGSIVRFAFGPDYFKEMKIEVLKPFSEVIWTCTSGAKEWIGTIISFRLQTVDRGSLLHLHPEMKGQADQWRGENGAVLVFHHDNWKHYTPMFAECNYTWALFLRSLKSLCETGTGRPWPYQHQ